MMRKEFPGKVRVAAWERSSGHCEECTRKLSPGDIYYEHIIPDGLTGTATLQNCGVYCKGCWSAKTRTYDIPAIAKAKRRQRHYIGIKRSQGRPMPGSKASGWKHKLTGEWVRR